MADIPVLQHQDHLNVARLKNLPQATTASEPVTLAQMQAVLEGQAWKDEVRVASVANINLASPGAAIDGVTMVTNDRFLNKDATAPAENGIYIWNGAAVAATRAADMSASAEFNAAVVSVASGTNAGTTWRQTAVDPNVGTTAIVWSSFNAGAPAASETTSGISERATQAETDGGTDDARHITPLKLANWTGRARRFSQNIGDGSATSIAITHNFGTLDVLVGVRRVSDGAKVLTDDAANTVNQVTLTFASAPAINAYRVTVIG